MPQATPPDLRPKTAVPSAYQGAHRELTLEVLATILLGLGPFGYQEIDMPFAATVGVVSWGICLIVIGRIVWIITPWRHWVRGLASVLVPILIGWAIWSPVQARLTEIRYGLPVLNSLQKREFTQVLKSAAAVPTYTKLACPAANEEACAYASTFIPLFQRAGWRIGGPEGPVVERVVLAVPTSEIVIVRRGLVPRDRQNPDLGVYQEFTAWDQIMKTAFNMVGINPLQWKDPNLPDGVYLIYFGSAPQKR